MRYICTCMVASIVIFSLASAEIPRTLSYQGVLTDSAGSPIRGSQSITFRLYSTPSGGSPEWSETKTIQTNDGLFSTILGDQIPIPSTLKFDRQYYLGIVVGSEAEMSPRVPLTSAAYSLNSVGSQWSVNGNDIFYNNGNVGIGTNTPSAKMHIFGNAAPGAHIPTFASVLASGDGWNNRLMSVHGDQSVYLSLWHGGQGELSTYDYETNVGLPLVLNSNGGNVGIGTWSPTARLEVNTGDSLGILGVSTKAGAPCGEFCVDEGGSGVTGLNNAAGGVGVKGIAHDADGKAVYGYSMQGWAGYFNGNVSVSNYLSANRIQVGSTTGNFSTLSLGVNGTDAYQGIGITNNLAGGKTITMNQGTVGKLNFTEPGVVDLVTMNFNTQRMGIKNVNPSYELDVSGTIRGTNVSPSDVRYKSEIQSLQGMLRQVQKLRGVSYQFRTDEFPDRNFSSGPQLGVIAQEVEQVFPELVSTDNDGYKAVDYAKFTPILIEAIKELSLMNEVLTSRIQNLNKTVNLLVEMNKQSGDGKFLGELR